ncbi:MAG: N-acetyl-gamma-glutamyl-phosphate reductase [Planctomycetota bacterium]|nr:MAG: N-acetyl-gamma-glutamyl-phosphate reductase [Planctomycetota bacterium]
MIRVGIMGATGYTAIEAIRILLRHPHVELMAATSRQAGGTALGDLHPQFNGRTNLMVEDLTPQETAERCDLVLCCLPHAASAPIVTELLAHGARVIDLSADYRLSARELYEHWYGVSHPDPGRIGSVPYGLPELFHDQIAGAKLVANPGCYPTSAILPLAPLIKHQLIETDMIIVDAKSGVSGAGRSPKLTNLYSEVNESVAAYSVGAHRHQPEIVDVLERFTHHKPHIVFTPHLIPMDRGILSTIYVRPTDGASANQIRECLATFYSDQPFVRVVPHLPATKHVIHTNYCDIAVRESDGWIVLLSAIDNLVKGASGAAVQCMNIMNGWDQTTALFD